MKFLVILGHLFVEVEFGPSVSQATEMKMPGIPKNIKS